MSYLNTPQPGAPTTRLRIGRWGPLAVLLAALLLLLTIGAVASIHPTASARPEQQPIIMLATVPPTPAPTAAPIALLGYFNFDDPRSATAFMAGDVVQVVGLAGDWRLIETRQGGRAWLRAGDVPAGVASADPLPNLAPPTAAPAPMVIDDAATAPPPSRVQPAPARVGPGEQPSDKPGPHDGASKMTPAQQPRVVPTSRPTPLACWPGPPAVLRPGQPACWRGVPFVLPAQP